MRPKNYFLFYLLVLLFPIVMNGQDITLYTQINGRYDFTFIGNTMNSAENNPSSVLVTGTSSTATLNLNPTDTVIKAFLYWAGSGDGDFDVLLERINVDPGVRTEVYGVESLTARSLIDSASEYHPIGDDLLL